MAMAAPRTLQAAAPDRAGAERLIESFVARGEGQPIDLAYRIEASRDYDPAEQLDRVVGPVLNVNFADDPLYPPTLDPMPGVTARYSTIRSIIVPAGSRTSGHGTLADPALWPAAVEAFIRSALERGSSS